jgi:hypothetical protein
MWVFEMLSRGEGQRKYVPDRWNGMFRGKKVGIQEMTSQSSVLERSVCVMEEVHGNS